MIYREARPPRLGLAFSKDSTAHLPRDTAFLQDSASRPMYPPHFSRIPPRACREMPHFSKIRPRAQCEASHFPEIRPRARRKPRISPRFDLSPDASPRIFPRFDLAPDASPVFFQDSTSHPTRGRILEKCDTSPLLQGHETILNAWLKAFDAYICVTFAFQIFL